jgi:uncharacterized membrane protein (Fun14 family)
MQPELIRIARMSETPSPTADKIGMFGFVMSHYAPLAGWKKLLLVLSMLLTVGGLSGQLVGLTRATPAPTVETVGSERAGANFTPEQLDKAKQQVATQLHWFYDRISPGMWRMGLGFVVAFIIGYVLRRALVWVVMLASLLLVGAGVASWMGWTDLQSLLNTAAEQGKGASKLAWDSGRYLMDRVAPGTASLVGLFVGFLKSK